MQIMYENLLSILFMLNLIGWCCSYTIQPIEFELLDEKFRLSIPNDPDIKWVSFNVNVNKEFKAFESGQLTGITSIPRDKKWSYEFDKTLKDNDIVYVWLAVQHNRLIFRDKKDPISVEAFRNCAPNCKFTTSNSVTDPRIEISTDAPKPIDVTLKNKICRPTISEVPRTFGGPYCRDDLIFSDDFNTIDSKYWTNEVRLPPTTDDAEFVLYNGTLGVENGILKIEASLNNKNLKKDSIDLGTRCTSINVDTECSLTPRGVLVLPPIISGRLSTKNHFMFKYGRIVVRAKMPKGEWLYPLISLLPSTPIYGDRYKSGEIRVAYIHGNQELKWQNKNIDGGRLYGGAIVKQNAVSRYQFMKDITLPNVKHFADDFHLYSLTWTPNELIMNVDGIEYGRIESKFKDIIHETIWNKGEKNAPLDQMFYITLGLAAGGNGDFPDTEHKPWGNTDPRGSLNFFRNRENWFPSWEQPSLEVDYVRVYAA